MNEAASAVAALLKKSAREIESEVRGTSMAPTLFSGTRIKILCTAEPYQTGDIVAILADPLIVHRVVASAWCRSKRYLITRGDASWYCDLPVTEDQILGVVTTQYDGSRWHPPRAMVPPPRPRSLLAQLSLRSMLVALRMGESWASFVARGGASIASWVRGRA